VISLEVDHWHEPCLVDVGYGEFQQCRAVASFEFQADFLGSVIASGCLDDADEILLAIHREAQRDSGLDAGKTDVIGQLLQRPVQTGRGHLEALVVDIFDRKHMGKLAAYFLAILNDDAGFRLIDIDTQQSDGGTLKLNQLVAHAVKGGFDQICQMHCIPE
jgi:hypothetical protein